jgi:hypothetical protein
VSNVISITGFKEFEAKIKGIPAYINKEVRREIQDAVLDWEQRAKNAVPVNYGSLKRGISSKMNTGLSGEVVSAANYSRFVEWGTRSKKRVPSDLASFESSLSYEKTGDYYDFLNSILDWVKKKGIGRTYNVKTRRKNRQTKDEFLAIAEAIAFSILRKGINPQPFFFIHKEPIKKELFVNIERILTTQR